MKQGSNVLLSFCVNDMLEVQAILNAVKEREQPSCLLVTENAIQFAGYNFLFALLQEAKRELKEKIIIQLDHGRDMRLIKQAINDKFDIVMFDGSNLSFEENVRKTKEVVQLAHANDAQVEGALGKVGDLFVGAKRIDGEMTDVQQAQEFAAKTAVDYLAVSVGNYHGNIHQKPLLDLDLIAKLSHKISCPLVLHGADFVDTNNLREAVKNGIRKINFGPEFRFAYWKALEETPKNLDSEDPRDILKLARSAMEKVLQARIKSLS